jgi:DUF1680 family protein
LRDHSTVNLSTETEYPGDGRVCITLEPAEEKAFAVKLRVPGWCRNVEVKVNGKRFNGRPNAEGYLAIERVWKKGDQIALQFKLEPRLVVGDHGNRGKVAVLYGPLVLAADEALLVRCNTLHFVC